MESQILSRIRYVAPFVDGQTEDLKSKVYKLMTDSARFVMKSYCYKQRMSAIFKEIGWKGPEETVDECSALFIHKIIHTNTPLSLYAEIKLPRTRHTGLIHTNIAAKMNKLSRTGLYAAT